MSASGGFDLRTGFELCGVTLGEVHVRYLGLGGVVDRERLRAIIEESETCPAIDFNRIAQALNEVFLDHGVATFPVAYFDSAPTSAAESLPRYPVANTTARRLHADAAAARQRSRVRSLQAADLQASAAELMEASGQLMFARRARRRSEHSQRRAAAITT